MKELPKMENKLKKESGVSRAVGFGTDTEEAILRFFKHKFETKKEEEIEKEHSVELDKVIYKINEAMKEFLAGYGVESFTIPAKNVLILDQNKLTSSQLEILGKRYGKTNGLYLLYKQKIVLLLDYAKEDKLRFLQSLVHEMFHVNSFVSYETTDQEGAIQLTRENDPNDKVNIRLRRMGFKIDSEKGPVYFYDIDEAIITELTMRFDWKYFSKIPEIADEYEAREEILKEALKSGEEMDDLRRSIANFSEESIENQTKKGFKFALRGYSYDEEREDLNDLIDELYEKNKSQFESEEDVFAVFAKAVLTGRLLPAARLIEQSFGKGSFKTLGVLTKEKK